MESVQSSEVVDECLNSQDKQSLDGVGGKRDNSQRLRNTDVTIPQIKAKTCDVLESEASAASSLQLNNGNVKSVRNQDADANHFTLEHFCYELLYEVIKFLDTYDLMSLMNVSERFQKIVLDKRLWEKINLIQTPLPLPILEKSLEYTHEKTHSIKLLGPSSSQLIDDEILHFNITLRNTFTTRCTKLTVMELYGVPLDFDELSFSDFPASLKRLVINNCNARIPTFNLIKTNLPNLEELAIEKNDWFKPCFLLAITELPILKYLSLKGCSQMKDIFKSNLAVRNGFQQLEILDLRETPLDNCDFTTLNKVANLKEIYLQCPADLNKLRNDAGQPSTSSCVKIQLYNAVPIVRLYMPTWGYITDLCVYFFGRTRGRFGRRPANRLERFIVRGYQHVTDKSLEYLVENSPRLVFLDVSGTSVTMEGIRGFKKLRPECEVVAEHLFDLET